MKVFEKSEIGLVTQSTGNSSSNPFGAMHPFWVNKTVAPSELQYIFAELVHLFGI